MSTQNKIYLIEDGPNRNDFVNAFLYAFDKDIALQVATYTMMNMNREKKRLSIKLFMIRHRDDTGAGFEFEGNCYYDRSRTKFARVQGYYNAQKRTGTMTVLDDIVIF